MATYVFSDVHGHFGTLDRLLERVSPTSDDTIFMLGDMIDRGPDPMGVVKCCYNLPNTTVLMGNHEDLMLSYYADPTDLTAQMNWEINGAGPTQSGLRSLPLEERVELARWLFTLPLYAQTEVGGRRYLLVHAGIDPTRVEADGIEVWDEQALDDVVGNQYRDDLMWIRDDFWGAPIISDGWKRKVLYALGLGSFNGGFSLRSRRLCEHASRKWFSFFRHIFKEDSPYLGEDFYYTTLLKLLPSTWFKFRFPSERAAFRFAFDTLGGRVSVPVESVRPFGVHGKATIDLMFKHEGSS